MITVLDLITFSLVSRQESLAVHVALSYIKNQKDHQEIPDTILSLGST
jgi:hypothetical protein